MKHGIRTILAMAGVSALAACATASGDTMAPVTPTSRYALEARPTVEEIALAQRADGLSPAQRAALGDIAMRARGRPIVIRAPAGGDPVAMRSAYNAKAHLEAMGVGGVRLASYDAPDGAAPILVGFASYEAVVPKCGRWSNLTSTRDNAGFENFGCAVTANMAAQISDPEDIVSPQPLDPTDAARRTTVLGKYRAGEVTAATRDTDAGGTVSRVVP